MVSLLLAITSDVDAIHGDKSAMSALMAAASNGSTPIVQKVLDAGAQVNLRNSPNNSAIYKKIQRQEPARLSVQSAGEDS